MRSWNEAAHVHWGAGRSRGPWPLAAWPRAARAQQPAMPVIGFLASLPVAKPTSARLSPGPQGGRLCRGRERRRRIPLGRGSGPSVAGAGDRTGSPTSPPDRRRPGPRIGGAAKAATATIPIVFAVSDDPVKLGLVASLARPAGNATGINFVSAEVVAKRLELLRVLVPGAVQIAVLVNPAAPVTETTLRDVEAAAGAMGLRIRISNAGTSGEINRLS